MLFIALVKFKEKPTMARIQDNLKRITAEAEEGITIIGTYWTLGRYDAVTILEAPNERMAMLSAIRRSDFLDIETLVAIPAETAGDIVANEEK